MIKNPRLSYIILCVVLLVMLTAGRGFRRGIQNLIVHDGKIYAEFNSGEGLFYSADGGETWTEVDFQIPSQVSGQLRQTPVELFTLCLPDDPNICYQTGTGKILESTDGGQTWDTSWEIPTGRRKFLTRNSPWAELGPYDIVFLEHEERQIVVAAAGTEGVLVKTDGGPWKPIAVDGAGPLLFKAANLLGALEIVTLELIIITLLSVLYLIINLLVTPGWSRTREFFSRFINFMAGLAVVLSSLVIIASVAFVLGIIRLDNHATVMSIFVVLVVGALSVTLSVVVFLIWQTMIYANQYGKIFLPVVFLVWLVSYTLFVLWAFGVIPVYETAEKLAVVLHVFALLWIAYLFVRRRIQTAKPAL